MNGRQAGAAGEAPRVGVLRGRPHLVVRVAASGCLYDIRFNDVSIMADRRGLPVRVELPVNQYATSGANVLCVRLAALPTRQRLADEASCLASLEVRQSGSRRESNEVIATLRYDGARALTGAGFEGSSPAGTFDSGAGFLSAKDGDVVAGQVAVRTPEQPTETWGEREVVLPLPFSRWAWLDAEPVEASARVKADLFGVYQAIWAGLQARKAGAVVPMFAERTRELACAFHRTEAEMLDVLGLHKAVADPELSLYPLDDEPELEVFGGGRLARVTRWDGTPLIAFAVGGGDVTAYYDLACRRALQGWVITR